MAYATSGDYTDWLKGRGETIPLAEFDFWSERASEAIDAATFDRLHYGDWLEKNKAAVIATTCAVAELIFVSESPQAEKELSSMSIGGDYSVSYVRRDESTPYERLQSAIRRGLGMTGLMSRVV